MKDILLVNIRELFGIRENPKLVVGSDLGELPSIENSFLHVREGCIHGYGKMDQLADVDAERIDLSGRYVFPSFVDSHTHLVFAGYRESEFVQKIQGATYQEIAAAGGGILNSAAKLRAMSEDELFDVSLPRAKSIMRQGTGTVEIKSGYGLTLQDELKMLRVARKIGEHTALKIKTTFLGAHAVPSDTTKEKYIETIKNEMIPRVAEEGLAEFIDVFCEEGFFSEKESIDILQTGREYGLTPKVHANQLHLSGGVQAGVVTQAISVDHLETVSPVELDALEGTGVIATLLPGAAFFLRSSYPPAREMIARNLPIAVASDFNPGSSPSGNMQTMWSLAAIGLKMTPKEALNAMTINGAFAMGMEEESGVIKKGRRADIIISHRIPSLEYIPYSFGENCFYKVMLNGRFIN